MSLDLLLVMCDLVSMALLQVLELLELLLSEVFVLCSLLLLAEGTSSLADSPLEIGIGNAFHNFQPYNFHWPWHSKATIGIERKLNWVFAIWG